MSIADDLKKSPQPNRPNAPRGGTPKARPDSGGEMALALTSAIQGQAVALANAAQAANISIDHASEQISDYMAHVLGGDALLAATLAKTQAKLEQRGTVAIEQEVQTIDLQLGTPSYVDARQGFMAMFNGFKQESENPWTKALEATKQDAANG
jgi:hypothetical protein